MHGSDLKRLKEIEQENPKLQQMYTNLALDHELAEIIEKALKSCRKRNIVKEYIHYGIITGRAVF